MSIEKRMLTPPQAAREFGLNVVTIYRWIHNGTLPAFQLPSGYFRIREGDLIELLTPTKPRKPSEIRR